MKNQGAVLAVSFFVMLAGCATVPRGPSVMALPGTGKNLSEFRSSDLQCRAYAAQVIGAASNDPAVRHALVGTAVGAAAGAAIGGQQGAGVGAGVGLLAGSVSGAEASRSYGYEGQRRYDEAYIQCMYASGHKVPVSATLAKGLQQKQSAAAPAVQPMLPPPPQPIAPPAAAAGANFPPPPKGAPPSSPPPDYVPPAPATR
jgi:hypothetical protein